MMSIPALALVCVFALSASAVAPPTSGSVPVQGCNGCLGNASSASASGGSCGGMLTITVNVISGQCKFLGGEEVGEVQCRSIKNCLPVVTRTWAGMPPASGLDFCVDLAGSMLCLNPKPNTGGGSGADTRPSTAMICSDDPENTRTYTISSGSCGLVASAQAKCTGCE